MSGMLGPEWDSFIHLVLTFVEVKQMVFSCYGQATGKSITRYFFLHLWGLYVVVENKR